MIPGSVWEWFRRIALIALPAGIAAGLALSAAQQVWVIPILLEAERFEAAAEPQAHAAGRAEDHAWEPAAGVERAAYTWLANAVLGFGWALLLVSVWAWRGAALEAKRGALWGLAGFAVFSLAPALGLPPALPGAPEAPLAARQAWWLATAAATAGGLALLAFARPVALRLLGLPLLAATHIVGAPRAAEALPAALAPLAPRFALASLACALGFWLVLGALAGWLWGRPEAAATPPAGAPLRRPGAA
jgi:cobalt transporter subunit CbtA